MKVFNAWFESTTEPAIAELVVMVKSGLSNGKTLWHAVICDPRPSHLDQAVSPSFIEMTSSERDAEGYLPWGSLSSDSKNGSGGALHVFAGLDPTIE